MRTLAVLRDFMLFPFRFSNNSWKNEKREEKIKIISKNPLTKVPSSCIIYLVAALDTIKRCGEYQLGSIAQLGEHLPYKQRVTGSSPVVPTNFIMAR